MKHFHKEIISNEVRLSDGRVAGFEPIGDDSGVLKTDDERLISLLGELISAHRGGVTEITEEQYEEFIKKKGDMPQHSRPRLSDPPKFPSQSVVADRRDVAAAERATLPKKRYGFGSPPPAEAAPVPAEAKQTVQPPVPAGDANVNRPTVKKVPPKTAPPEGNVFP